MQRKIKCQECGADNPIYAVSCEACKKSLYPQEPAKKQCQEIPSGVGMSQIHESPDRVVIEESSAPKLIMFVMICPNCGMNSLVYNRETTFFECCLDESQCGARFALARVMDE